jgi:hypothetical protein
MVTRIAWIAARLVSSAASWTAITADDWKRRSVCIDIISEGSVQKRDWTYLEILCDLTNETSEGEFPDKELSRLLVATNFTKSDCSRVETMGLLDTGSVMKYKLATSSAKKKE